MIVQSVGIKYLFSEDRISLDFSSDTSDQASLFLTRKLTIRLIEKLCTELENQLKHESNKKLEQKESNISTILRREIFETNSTVWDKGPSDSRDDYVIKGKLCHEIKIKAIEPWVISFFDKEKNEITFKASRKQVQKFLLAVIKKGSLANWDIKLNQDWLLGLKI